MNIIRSIFKSFRCNRLALTLSHKINTLEKMVKLYRYDKLTGFKLRHDYDIDINNSCSKGIYTYLTIIDINRLHYINEEYGYIAGDKHIVSISKSIKRSIKDGKYYRIGGDEFAVLHHNSLHGLYIRNSTHSTVLLSEYTDYREIMVYVKEDLKCKKEIWYNVKGLDRRE